MLEEMKTVPATEFKQRCLAILDNLDREGLVITKRGKPVARMMPIESGCAQLIGSMKDHIVIRGDILSTGTRWNAGS